MIDDQILSLPVEEAEFCVLDVETTGLSPRTNNIIEIGLVKVSKLKIGKTYHSVINPGRNIPYFITGFTGITNEEVFDAPFFDEISEEITKFIGDNILAGHNFSFDKSFIKKEFLSCGKSHLTNPDVCTLKIARRIYPMLRSKALGAVCNHLKIKNSASHRALGDAKVTARILVKMIKELKENYGLTTVGDLLNFQHTPKTTGRPLKIKKKLYDDVVSLPAAPGIYYFLNSKNEIIYIGKAKSLKDRIKSYFSPTAPSKSRRIVRQASRLKIEIMNSELTALLSEAELIKLINPRHNTQLKKYGNKYFLRIKKTHNVPSIEVTNFFDFDGNDYFGLFTTKRKAESVYDMLQRIFAVRECDDKELGKKKACFLAETERCTAPCVNNDNQLYFSELEKVYEFLYGKNQFALNRLIHKMKDYSERQKYEKAAETKEIIDLLLAQTHKSSLLSEPVNDAKVLFEIDEGYEKDYILMIEGKIFIKKYAVKNKDDFDEALTDYYDNTFNLQFMPDDEDLEKMKITLNWLIKNRNKVRIFYLKDYKSKQELFTRLSRDKFNGGYKSEANFDVKELVNIV